MAVGGCGLAFSGSLYQSFGRKKNGERNRDVFASAAMVMEFTGMLCLYPVNSPAAFSWAGFCEMGIWLRADGFRWLYSTIAAFMWMMTTLFSMEYFRPTRQSRKILFLFPVNLRGNHGRISVRQPVLTVPVL
mgnify:CR=1 FL=1